MALPYNALALGRWGALVVYAGAPWVLARLFRATGTAPFGPTGARPVSRIRTEADGDAEGGTGRRTVSVRRRFSAWTGRHGMLRSVVALGLLEAVLVSFVPAAAIVVVLAGAGAGGLVAAVRRLAGHRAGPAAGAGVDRGGRS